MKRFKQLVMALSAAVALSCGAGSDATPEAAAKPRAAEKDSESSSPPKSAKESLARLSALKVVHVGSLIIDVPAEAMQCYGPCPGYEDEITRAKAKAAKRLAKLVRVAEKTADAKPSSKSASAKAIKSNIAALNALRIVYVGSLVEAKPANNPNCYNRPCKEDRDLAKQTTERRAAHLAALAKAAKGL